MPCICKLLHKQHLYPIPRYPAQTGVREKHRGSVYSPCHALPESFVTRSSKYFCSAQLQRSQEAAGCGGSHGCSHRGRPPLQHTPREASLRKSRSPSLQLWRPVLPWRQHPKLFPPKGLYCSKSVPAPLVQCFIVLRQWLSFFLSLWLLEQLESSGLRPEDYSSPSSWDKVGQSKDTE